MTVTSPSEWKILVSQFLNDLQALWSRLRSLEEIYVLPPESILGAGAFGSVVRMQERSTGRKHAVKFVLQSSLESSSCNEESFCTELSAMMDLDHSNIVRTLGLYKCKVDAEVYIGGRLALSPGTYFCIAMEEVNGRPLAEKIQLGLLLQDTSMPEYYPVPRSIGIQLCQALEYMHTQGIAHCDVHPGNVMLSPENVVTIVDLGLASFYKAKASGKTRVNKVNADYASPEAYNNGVKGPETDCWSVGIVLAEMLSGILISKRLRDSGDECVSSGSASHQACQWELRKLHPSLTRLLAANPQERLTMRQAIQLLESQQAGVQVVRSQLTSAQYCDVSGASSATNPQVVKVVAQPRICTQAQVPLRSQAPNPPAPPAFERSMATASQFWIGQRVLYHARHGGTWPATVSDVTTDTVLVQLDSSDYSGNPVVRMLDHSSLWMLSSELVEQPVRQSAEHSSDLFMSKREQLENMGVAPQALEYPQTHSVEQPVPTQDPPLQFKSKREQLENMGVASQVLEYPKASVSSNEREKHIINRDALEAKKADVSALVKETAFVAVAEPAQDPPAQFIQQPAAQVVEHPQTQFSQPFVPQVAEDPQAQAAQTGKALYHTGHFRTIDSNEFFMGQRVQYHARQGGIWGATVVDAAEDNVKIQLDACSEAGNPVVRILERSSLWMLSPEVVAQPPLTVPRVHETSQEQTGTSGEQFQTERWPEVQPSPEIVQDPAPQVTKPLRRKWIHGGYYQVACQEQDDPCEAQLRTDLLPHYVQPQAAQVQESSLAQVGQYVQPAAAQVQESSPAQVGPTAIQFQSGQRVCYQTRRRVIQIKRTYVSDAAFVTSAAAPIPVM